MTGITEREVVNAWSLPPPVRIEPISVGTNNQSSLVEAGGTRYLLKSYRNVPSPDRLRFEHALLGVLNASGLPFAVPAPVPAVSGDTSISIERARDIYRASLFHFIPGSAARAGSESDGYRCGEALAMLHRALGAVRLDPAIPVPETYGDLASIHPLVPHPVAATRRALEDRALADRIADIAAIATERWHWQTAGWETQIIHSDFYPANTLMDGGEVTGIVDFEFAGRGYRAMDFAIGMAAFSTRSWDDGCSWPVLEAFARGYLRRLPLTRDELAAVPVLVLIRELVSFVHWLGRFEQGLTTRADMHDRARRVLSLQRWLEGNGDAMVHRVAAIDGL